jgi:hypothetical protein
MTILWPAVARRLFAEADHWARRLSRMESMAEGGRVDWNVFGESRAYVEGLADAYAESKRIIGESRLTGTAPPLDMAVIILAQQGCDVEVIANRCGVTEREVAESLIRYVEAGVEEDLLGEGGEPE